MLETLGHRQSVSQKITVGGECGLSVMEPSPKLGVGVKKLGCGTERTERLLETRPDTLDLNSKKPPTLSLYRSLKGC